MALTTQCGARSWARLAALIVLGVACALPVRAQVSPDHAYAAWARVLVRFVNELGEIDFVSLARDRADLELFLGYIERVSPRSAPESFPGTPEKLAYYINAYNALAMFNVLDYDIPAQLTGLGKVRFFGFKRLPIGGERLTLYALENDVIRPLGDERVHFALNCMVAGCPRLPRVPFGADALDRQLDTETRAFFGEQRNLQVDAERKRVRVSALLEFYTEDFLARAPTLIDYINRYAGTPVPADYEIEFIDYDWTINRQHRDRRSSLSAESYAAAR